MRANFQTVAAKIQTRAGLTIGLAACLSIGGALAMALSGGQRAIAQLQTAQQTESPGQPGPNDTQGPNTAPVLQDTPSPGSTESPSPTETPSPESTETPAVPGDSTDPNPTPEIQETPAAPPDGTPSPESTESPLPTETPSPESTETPTSQEPEIRTENIIFVNTAEGAPTSAIEGQADRFSQIVGSGRLLVNQDDQVTGYYFIVSGLGPSQTFPYDFRSSRSGSESTSCEGDKGVLEDQTAGEALTPLSQAAPLQSTAGGVGIVGSASSPVQLPSPVPLKDIGYLNIQANENADSGFICANVPLVPVKYGTSATVAPESTSEPSPEPTPESTSEPSPELSPTPSPESTTEPTPLEPAPEETQPVPPAGPTTEPQPEPSPGSTPLPESPQ